MSKKEVTLQVRNVSLSSDGDPTPQQTATRDSSTPVNSFAPQPKPLFDPTIIVAVVLGVFALVIALRIGR